MLTIKVAATGIGYFARSKFSRNLAQKENFAWGFYINFIVVTQAFPVEIFLKILNATDIT